MPSVSPGSWENPSVRLAYFLCAVGGEGGGHDSPFSNHNSAQTWRYLPLFGSGRGASGLRFTATEAAPCAERYSRSRRSIAFQTFSGSAPRDVSSGDSGPDDVEESIDCRGGRVGSRGEGVDAIAGQFLGRNILSYRACFGCVSNQAGDQLE